MSEKIRPDHLVPTGAIVLGAILIYKGPKRFYRREARCDRHRATDPMSGLGWRRSKRASKSAFVGHNRASCPERERPCTWPPR